MNKVLCGTCQITVILSTDSVSGAGDLDMLLPSLECPEPDMPHPHITVMRPEAVLHMRSYDW